MSHVALAIAATEARDAVLRLPTGTPLPDRFRTAMATTYRHWMATDESDQFMAACEAVYATASDEEKERIEAEMRTLAHLNAMLSGVPVDFDAMAEQMPADPIGIRKIWTEVVS